MDRRSLSGKDLLLALLYCPGSSMEINEPIIGRTKLTKMIYLFEKEIYKEFDDNLSIVLPKFEPYNYGPFSRELFEDLKFFLSIGLVKTEETLVPISSADKYEFYIDLDENIEDEWSSATFEECNEDVELKYLLSDGGVKYVQDKIWNIFSEQQRIVLKAFKRQINSISLDSLLNYVYNKYPDDTVKSLISNKYLGKDTTK